MALAWIGAAVILHGLCDYPSIECSQWRVTHRQVWSDAFCHRCYNASVFLSMKMCLCQDEQPRGLRDRLRRRSRA